MGVPPGICAGGARGARLPAWVVCPWGLLGTNGTTAKENGAHSSCGRGLWGGLGLSGCL